jgi:PhoPQ-activated pathogenicity-related protein
MVKITERKTKRDWTCFLEEIANQYERAEKITLAMDNLNTHVPGSFYETFQPDRDCPTITQQRQIASSL